MGERDGGPDEGRSGPAEGAEVEGHAHKIWAAPQEGQPDEVTRWGAVPPDDAPGGGAEVEGHAWKVTGAVPQDAQGQAGAEPAEGEGPEVEGHGYKFH